MKASIGDLGEVDVVDLEVESVNRLATQGTKVILVPDEDEDDDIEIVMTKTVNPLKSKKKPIMKNMLKVVEDNTIDENEDDDSVNVTDVVVSANFHLFQPTVDLSGSINKLVREKGKEEKTVDREAKVSLVMIEKDDVDDTNDDMQPRLPGWLNNLDRKRKIQENDDVDFLDIHSPEEEDVGDTETVDEETTNKMEPEQMDQVEEMDESSSPKGKKSRRDLKPRYLG